MGDDNWRPGKDFPGQPKKSKAMKKIKATKVTVGAPGEKRGRGRPPKGEDGKVEKRGRPKKQKAEEEENGSEEEEEEEEKANGEEEKEEEEDEKEAEDEN